MYCVLPSTGSLCQSEELGNDLSSSVFDGHHHRKNTLFKTREDDVAIIEIPNESLGNSFSCVDS